VTVVTENEVMAIHEQTGPNLTWLEFRGEANTWMYILVISR
jgi:hypothetical protein